MLLHAPAANNVAWWFHQTALALALHVADTNTTMDLAFALPDLANEQISIDGILVKEVTYVHPPHWSAMCDALV